MTSSALDYVNNLEIPDLKIKKQTSGLSASPPRSSRSEFSLAEVGNKPSAALINGQVTAFTAGLSGQDKQDVEYTTLAAQLNSDVKVPDNQSLDGMRAWFRNYATVMSNLGWIMSFDWERYRAGSQGLRIDQVVLEVLAAVASQNGAAIAKAALDAVQKLPKDGDRIKLFSNATTSDKAGKFLLGVAAKEKQSVSLAFGAFAMDYATRDTTVLWLNWKSNDIGIYKDQKVATFNQDYYANGVRKALESKFKDYASTYVGDLDLGL